MKIETQKKEMTIGGIIKVLITCKNYNTIRCVVPDEFINFVKENFLSQYEYFADKEQAYQELINAHLKFKK